MVRQAYGVSIEAEGADARPAWDDLVAQEKRTPLSRTPEWADCICSTGRFTDATLLLRGGDGRRFILPRLRRARAASLVKQFESPPVEWDLGADGSGFLGEGGPASPGETRALIQEVQRHAGLRTRVFVAGHDAEAWEAAAPSTIHATAETAQVLDLSGGFSTVWSKRFTSKVRSNARKAERRGVVVESDKTGRLVPAFDLLYRSSVDRWAQERGLPLPVMRWLAMRRNPQSKYALVANRMGERCTIWIASRQGEPIAGLIVLSKGPWAIFWRGAMDKERSRGTGANEFLHRCAIETATAEERQSYDFGLSQIDELRKFKASFGAVEVPVRTYYIERLPTAAAQAAGRKAAKQAVRAVTGLLRTR